MLRRLGAARDTLWIAELFDSRAERNRRAIWGAMNAPGEDAALSRDSLPFASRGSKVLERVRGGTPQLVEPTFAQRFGYLARLNSCLQSGRARYPLFRNPWRFHPTAEGRVQGYRSSCLVSAKMPVGLLGVRAGLVPLAFG